LHAEEREREREKNNILGRAVPGLRRGVISGQLMSKEYVPRLPRVLAYSSAYLYRQINERVLCVSYAGAGCGDDEGSRAERIVFWLFSIRGTIPRKDGK
jgi:hypothetical protein